MNKVKHGLSAAQVDVLRKILAGFADKIVDVGLFGSRATGNARPNSDIDLVIYGEIDQPLVDRIWTLCESSNLALSVDVVGYDLITHPRLKAHIDQVMQPLFSQAELRDCVKA